MFACKSKVSTRLLSECYYDEKKAARMPVCIDQSMVIKGNENSFGFPESDVALMLKAQSQDEIAYYMSRMRDMRINENNEGLSDVEIAAKVIPASANTPSSYANAVYAAQKYFVERSRVLSEESQSVEQVSADKPATVEVSPE